MLRTQDLEPIFEENSNIYIFSRTSFRESNLRIGKKPSMYAMDKMESIDIDELHDFKLAETLMKERLSQ
jgi:CMP-N-acetylneuraminic acid synthetase